MLSLSSHVSMNENTVKPDHTALLVIGLFLMDWIFRQHTDTGTSIFS